MVTSFKARRLIGDSGEVEWPVITVEDGRIAGIGGGEPNGSTETLTSAFFDVHVHGACSHDFMAATVEEISVVGRFLATRGVAQYLPTTVTGPMDLTLRALETMASAIERASDGKQAIATPVGIHLEGPFVSHAKRGVHPEISLREPSVALFDRFQEAARGHIRLMTLAPELPHALELIEHATQAGVRVTMGHSKATSTETLAAIAAGATSSTHLFNAMRPLDHREPGIVGTILDREDVYAEAICDGVHVHPAVIRLWLKMKGEERAILVTDGMSATGMPDGAYTLGDFTVEVRDGVCLSGETLAGSVLTMDQAVANVQRFTGSSLAMAVRLASRNPARMMGMTELTSLAVGSPANFNVFDAMGDRTGSILHGRLVE
jgi:N-acetylglucosamine-6-phosphate deacetylase